MSKVTYAESDGIYRRARRNALTALVDCVKFLACGGSLGDWNDQWQPGLSDSPEKIQPRRNQPGPGATTGACAFRALAVDGALNLAELRATEPSERREAFRKLGSTLRNLVNDSQPGLAAILTVESAPSQAGDVDFEDFLADVVIASGLCDPAGGRIPGPDRLSPSIGRYTTPTLLRNPRFCTGRGSQSSRRLRT
jgi:hypothetical protein